MPSSATHTATESASAFEPGTGTSTYEQPPNSPVDHVFVTCEHASCEVPENWAEQFAVDAQLLTTHRAFDQGAAELARSFSTCIGAKVWFGSTTRLLVDLNRSLHHPQLFSEYTRDWPVSDRRELLRTLWLPYRQSVEAQLCAGAACGERVLHVSVHSFTPHWEGEKRPTDLAWLFDPQRKLEADLARTWRAEMSRLRPDLVLHENRPYSGTEDGFTSELRTRLPESGYLGIELEWNQALVSAAEAARLGKMLARSLGTAIANMEAS